MVETLEAELAPVVPLPAQESGRDGRLPAQRPGARPARLTFERLRQFWAVRSLAAGALSSCLDLVVLIALVQLGHLNPVLGSMVGVVAGGTVNFFLNKYFAFRDRDPKVGRQILRYAVGTGIALGLHAAVVYTLTVHLRLNYILAKLAADVLVFSVGGLLLNRYVVFPEKAGIAQQAGRTLACLALAAAFTGTPALPSGGVERAPIASPFEPLVAGSRGPCHQTAGATDDAPSATSLAQAMAPRAAVLPVRSSLHSEAFRRPTASRRPPSPELRRRRRPPKSAA